MTTALAFDCPLTLDAMLARLNQLGPWTWRESDSDTYGESLWAVPGRRAWLSISPVDNHWVIEIRCRMKSEALPQAQLEREVTTRVLPALGARNVRPTEATR
jgi:hypothetical protein